MFYREKSITGFEFFVVNTLKERFLHVLIRGQERVKGRQHGKGKVAIKNNGDNEKASVYK